MRTTIITALLALALFAGTPAHANTVLLNWHTQGHQVSPAVSTPLTWVLRWKCDGGKMRLDISDLQLPLVSETVVCDGRWHEETYSPLEDSVFISTSKPAWVQIIVQ